jgi:hypothetical protein
MPADWKVASVVPVPKSGKKPGLLEGYRPISLLSTISKLMESILTSFLSKFCEKNNFFPSHQAGFRKYRSTIDAVLRLVHDAAEGRSKESNLATIAVFLDFRAAFDSVWHNGLRLVLKSLNLPLPVLRLLSSFLRDRQFFVRVDDCFSNLFSICCGVPQGSPLSAILFIIFTTSMFKKEVDPDDALRDIAFASYADDVSLWASARPSQCAVARVQSALRVIECWSMKWRLAINPSKCEALTLAYMPRVNFNNFHLYIDSAEIRFTDSFKYLGVWISPRLGWAKHIDHISKKCAAAIHALRTICRNRRLHCSIGLLLYKALVRSLIEYSAPVWFGTSFPDHLLNKLCTIERKCLKIVLGLRKNTSNDDLIRVTKEKFPTFQFLPDRLADLTFLYYNGKLSGSAEIGQIVRECQNSNPKSCSPVRFFLSRLLGSGPLQPFIAPIFENDEITIYDEA